MEKKTSIAIKILPDGDIVMLYSDDSPLKDLGRLNLQRASNVEWDHIGQYWVIYMIDPDTGKRSTSFLPQTFENRGEAIQHEIKMLNGLINEGLPVEKVFKQYVPKR